MPPRVAPMSAWRAGKAGRSRESRSPTRTFTAPRDCAPRAALGCSRISSARTTRTSWSGSTLKARCFSANATWTSSRWVHRARARTSARCAILGTPSACPAAPPVDRRRRRRAHGAGGDGHGYRRLHPAAGGIQRRLRSAAHVWAGIALWPHRLRIVARPGGAHGAQRGRPGCIALCHGGVRPPRLDEPGPAAAGLFPEARCRAQGIAHWLAEGVLRRGHRAGRAQGGRRGGCLVRGAAPYAPGSSCRSRGLPCRSTT